MYLIHYAHHIILTPTFLKFGGTSRYSSTNWQLFEGWLAVYQFSFEKGRPWGKPRWSQGPLFRSDFGIGCWEISVVPFFECFPCRIKFPCFFLFLVAGGSQLAGEWFLLVAYFGWVDSSSAGIPDQMGSHLQTRVTWYRWSCEVGHLWYGWFRDVARIVFIFEVYDGFHTAWLEISRSTSSCKHEAAGQGSHIRDKWCEKKCNYGCRLYHYQHPHCCLSLLLYLSCSYSKKFWEFLSSYHKLQ